MSELKKLTPAELAEKIGVSKQAVLKKISNTISQQTNPQGKKNKNVLPEGLIPTKYGRFYVIEVPEGFRFVKIKKRTSK